MPAPERDNQFPRRQGTQDGLCGFYSLLNLIIDMLPGMRSHESLDDFCEELFRVMWDAYPDALETSTGSNAAATNVMFTGIDPAPLLELTRRVLASPKLAEITEKLSKRKPSAGAKAPHGWVWSCEAPYRKDQFAEIGAFFADLKIKLAGNRDARKRAIIGLGGDYNHWTVLSGFRPGGWVQLRDSWDLGKKRDSWFCIGEGADEQNPVDIEETIIVTLRWSALSQPLAP